MRRKVATMRIESGRVTWVSKAYTRENRKNGGYDTLQDFTVQWHDGQSGQFCSLGFTVRNKMNIIGKLSVNMFVKLEYVVETKTWTNPKTGQVQVFNNTRILGDSLHCVARKG